MSKNRTQWILTIIFYIYFSTWLTFKKRLLLLIIIIARSTTCVVQPGKSVIVCNGTVFIHITTALAIDRDRALNLSLAIKSNAQFPLMLNSFNVEPRKIGFVGSDKNLRFCGLCVVKPVVAATTTPTTYCTQCVCVTCKLFLWVYLSEGLFWAFFFKVCYLQNPLGCHL